jgi:hypothetical protein
MADDAVISQGMRLLRSARNDPFEFLRSSRPINALES